MDCIIKQCHQRSKLESCPVNLDMQNFIDSMKQALVKNDTEALKGVLRQCSYADSVVPPLTNGHAEAPVLLMFLQLTVNLPVSFSSNDLISTYHGPIGNLLLRLGVVHSDYELIKLLLENRADVTSIDKQKRTVLHIACKTASLEIIKLLTEESPAYFLDLTDFFDCTPLDYACQYNCPDVVRFLLSKGSSVGGKGENRFPVQCAVFHKVAEYRMAIVSILLDAGADINHADSLYGTPLIAALNRHGFYNNSCVDICMLLIERGCDVNFVDFDNQIALHHAVEEELESLVRKLLVSGSDVDKCNRFGETPLHIACAYGNQRLVDLLIISGANLRALDRETTLENWRISQNIDEKNTQLLNYIIDESKKCLTLEQLCNITIRKNLRNVEKDAIELGLPPLLVKCLQLKD